MIDWSEIKERLRCTINMLGVDTALNVPDYILSDLLVNILMAQKNMIDDRDEWFGFIPFKQEI